MLPSAFVRQCLAHERAGRVAAAIDDYTRATELPPPCYDAWLNRGTLSLAAQRYDDALGDFAKAIAIDSARVEGYVNRSTVWLRTGEFDKALEESLQAIRVDPRMVHGHLNRATALGELGRVDDAEASFAAAERCDERQAEIYYGRAVYVHAARNDAKNMAADCSRAIAIDPRQPKYWYVRGRGRLAMDEYEAALADFLAYQKLDPARASAADRYIRACRDALGK